MCEMCHALKQRTAHVGYGHYKECENMRNRTLQGKIDQAKIALSGVWSKKRFILAPALIISLLGWTYVATMQNQYESKARIYADTDSILNSLLAGIAVQEDAKEEVKITSRTLLSREVREDIAKQSDLHLSAPTEEDFDRLVESLKDKIVISGSTSTNVYDISFTHSNPKMSKRVVDITLKKFLDDSTGKTRMNASAAQSFLVEQKENYVTQLNQIEESIAIFRQENQDLLMNNGSGVYRLISEAQTNLAKIDQEIASRQAQIKGMKSRFLPGANGIDGNGPEIVVETPYDQRLFSMQDRLDQLQLRYTDLHPTIVELKGAITLLKEQQRKAQEEIISSASSGALTASSQQQANALQTFSLRISELSSEIDMLTVRKKEAEETIALLQKNRTLIPAKEAELESLEREHAKTKATFDALVDKIHKAEISINADKDTQNVKFKIIEAPRVANKPVGPPRVIFYTAVLILALATGVVLAFVMSQISPVINGATHLNTLIGRAQIIGLIEHTESAAMRRKGRIKAALFFGVLLVLIGIYAALVGHDIILGESPLKWFK